MGEVEDECPVQAVVGFPGVLCREPLPVAKFPTPSPPSSSAPYALWVRILGKVRFGLKTWVLRSNRVRGWLQRGFDRQARQGGSSKLESRSMSSWGQG